MRTHLAERLTWRYTDAHAHKDEWSDTVQGYFQILSVSQPVYPPNANRDTWCKYLRVKAPAHLTRNEVVRVLSSNFRHGCTCEHDCCGHVFSWANDVRHIKRREWRVEVCYAIHC